MDANGMEPELLAECRGKCGLCDAISSVPDGNRYAGRAETGALKVGPGGADRYIIEDDYDSEFRYRGKPIPALQGMDRNGR